MIFIILGLIGVLLLLRETLIIAGLLVKLIFQLSALCIIALFAGVLATIVGIQKLRAIVGHHKMPHE
jgi:hypothetical protein